MKFLVRFVFTGLALLLLAAGWVYLYTHSRAVDGERQNATLALLKDVKKIDSDWTADVLKSQSELNLSYDPLASALQKFAHLFVTLKADTARLNDPEVNTTVAEIERLIGAKASLVDRFKAKNALLRNSLRYAPTVSKEIQGQLRSMRSRAGPAEVAALMQLESALGQLVSDGLRYNSVPDVETGESLKAGIEKTRLSIVPYRDALHEPVNNLLAHLDVIWRTRTGLTAVLNGITEVPVVAKTDSLNHLLAARFQNELMQQYTYQRLLLGYSALALFLVFGAAGLIAYRNATERERLAAVIAKQTRELKENEVQLVHAQKMNALGEMVAGITHEINTPLAAVKSGLQSSNDLIQIVREYVDQSAKLATALATNPDDELGRIRRRKTLMDLLHRDNQLRAELASFDAIGTISSLLSEGIRNVEYIHRIIVNMLNFSRLDRSRICSVKIEEGIDSVLLMTNHLIRKIRVTRRYGDTRPIYCDIAQINQVVLNLVKNAAQALPEEGGDITIETSSSKSELRIAISDNGPGIPDEILAKIWDPFFTTKKAGSGTGLGLSTCKKIIESHGGRIHVATAPGKGTTFTVVLPTTPPESLYKALGQQPGTQLVVAA